MSTFTCFFIVIFLINFHTCQGKRLIICRITNVDICETSSDPPLIYLRKANLINPKNNNTILDLQLETTQDIDNFKVVIEAQRCISQEVLDSCEQISILKPIESCMFMTVKGMFWSKFTNSFHPPVSCPIKKANYSAYGPPIDPNIFTMFKIDGLFWRTYVHIYNGNEFVKLCLGFKVHTVNIA